MVRYYRLVSLLARDGLPLGLVGEEAHGVDVVRVGQAEPVVHVGRLAKHEAPQRSERNRESTVHRQRTTPAEPSTVRSAGLPAKRKRRKTMPKIMVEFEIPEGEYKVANRVELEQAFAKDLQSLLYDNGETSDCDAIAGAFTIVSATE